MPKRKSPKRSPKRRSPKRRSPKRSPKRKSPKRKSPKRRSPKRSPRKRSPRKRTTHPITKCDKKGKPGSYKKCKVYSRVMSKRSPLKESAGGLTKLDIRVHTGKSYTIKSGPNKGKKVTPKRYVSKERSNLAREAYKAADSPIRQWNLAVQKAKRQLGYNRDEFIAVKKGSPLYKSAKAIYNKMKKSPKK